MNMFWEIEVEGSGCAKYTVRWCRQYKPDKAQYGWECNCKEYQWRGRHSPDGYCKHIRAVIAEGKKCSWNEEMEVTAEPDECQQCHGSIWMDRLSKVCPTCSGTGKVCPSCGGPVRAVDVAV